MTAHKLPDVVLPGLKVVFCGTAAGTRSARVGAYYAGRGNRFWRTLHQIGLTPRLLDPHEFVRLPEYGIGLTDIAKTYSGADSGLRGAHFDAAGCAAKSIPHRRACWRSTASGRRRRFTARWSLTGSRRSIGATTVFVLPSTSGAASGFWDVSRWQALADFLAQAV
ncbi:MAG: mismatch-specific DNA-glycosylase [Anaerolineae bacterium]